ncbi:hypothetical protein [Vibrio ishigakensis]|uniref:hypothetical protein n=1 Tax=Vibrio ishigakensis TaxID=1481914 RepID=UPI0021C45D0E|nr:hypothetical protein [Vibrio ishigakensis]
MLVQTLLRALYNLASTILSGLFVAVGTLFYVAFLMLKIASMMLRLHHRKHHYLSHQ